jgi:hypothetical protein
MTKKETEVQKISRLRALRLARDASKPKAIAPDYPILGISDALPFGKHKGESLVDVLESDPGWLRWALENIKGFVITDEVEDELKSLDDPRSPRF